MKWLWSVGPIAAIKAILGACKFMEDIEVITRDHERRLQAIEERHRRSMQ